MSGAPGWRELRQHRIATQRAETLEKKKERGRPSPSGRAPAEKAEDEPAKSARSGKSSATKPRIGFLRASHIERAFIALIYATVGGLIAVSVIGTFYGRAGNAAPITDPGAIWATMRDSGNAIWWALVVQGVLSLTQYGARQMARHDGRWWLVYLASLGVSVYYNIQAYYTPLLIYMLPAYAYLLILAFDVIPEFVSLRHD